MKPVRPIQPVKAMVIDKDVGNRKTDKMAPKSPKTPLSPGTPFDKKEIAVVVTDNLDNFKRNKTFRKSLRMSFKRPVMSPAQVGMAGYSNENVYLNKALPALFSGVIGL